VPGAAAVLAIDPGRTKCGIAVVRSDGAVEHRAIVSAEQVVDAARSLLEVYAPAAIVVGGGTGAQPILDALRAAGLNAPTVVMDEAHTSEAARARFVATNPARGWQRLLPRSLRTPDRPYDDYVAVILAERWLASQQDPT
jgi:RNase H-fold protein (predicted Holliday junction resolvase)